MPKFNKHGERIMQPGVLYVTLMVYDLDTSRQVESM
jgi:hypothetical protein